jgi:hypothetical protein
MSKIGFSMDKLLNNEADLYNVRNTGVKEEEVDSCYKEEERDYTLKRESQEEKWETKDIIKTYLQKNIILFGNNSKIHIINLIISQKNG